MISHHNTFDHTVRPVSTIENINTFSSSLGWEEFCDTTSGFYFWVNEDTGESTWTLPEGTDGEDPNPIIVERQSLMETKNPL